MIYRRASVFGLLALLGTLIDLVTKQRVFAWKGLPGEQPPTWWIENYFGIETAVNQGAVFGLGQGYGWLFATVSIAAILGLLIWLFAFQACRSWWLTATLGMVTGGILGNLYDRLNFHGLPGDYAGGVRDWILCRYGQYTWPNFNIADSLLVVGAVMLAIHSLFFSDGSDRSDRSV
ncbi:MAG: signal peptidase II [Planctomycetes bacterium]|nr:signal peptidase II [Planctomycetota bacterium]